VSPTLPLCTVCFRALSRPAMFAAWLGVAAATPFAMAQTTEVLRGDVAAVDAGMLKLRSSTGQETAIDVPAGVRVGVRAPASLDTIKAGAFVGTTAKAQSDGTLLASEVHIFPESARGTGEGHRPMASLPGSTMTNATVASVSAAPGTAGSMTNAAVANVGIGANSRTLRLTYAGGEQTVVVPEGVPVVTLESGNLASLTPSQHVIVYATRHADGRLTAERISVGKNGSTPPN
jgi:hypothetical protein